MPELKLFICRRDDIEECWWCGALIIGAESKEEAIGIFIAKEGEEPYSVEVMDIKKGVLYDDQLR